MTKWQKALAYGGTGLLGLTAAAYLWSIIWMLLVGFVLGYGLRTWQVWKKTRPPKEVPHA